MDYLKKASYKFLGPGGLRCGCCNPFFKRKDENPNKKKVRRRARKVVKQQDDKLFNEI